jgi:hypothetical protein
MHTKLWQENLKKIEYYEDRGVDVRIILRQLRE